MGLHDYTRDIQLVELYPSKMMGLHDYTRDIQLVEHLTLNDPDQNYPEITPSTSTKHSLSSVSVAQL